jgi:TRAP-type C4-dicarboxylate transport system permease large subunit
MFISYERYGWEWLYSPIVAGILLVTLYGIIAPFFKNKRKGGHSERANIPDMIFTIVLTLMCILIFLHSTTMPFSAGIVPGIMGGFAMLFLTCIVVWQNYKYRLDKLN